MITINGRYIIHGFDFLLAILKVKGELTIFFNFVISLQEAF